MFNIHYILSIIILAQNFEERGDLKRIINIISNDPLFEDGNTQLTTVPLIKH